MPKKYPINGFDVVPKLSIKVLFKALFLEKAPIKYKYTFNLTRSAFDFLLKNLPLSHCRIIVPEFICPVIYEVCRRNKIKMITVPPDPETYNLDLKELAKINLAKIDGIFVNHTFGNMVDIEKVKKIIGQRKIFIIEDFAGAPPQAELRGDFGLISFHKKLANVGGGALLTSHNFDEPYSKLQLTRLSLAELRHLVFILNTPLRKILNLRRRKSPLFIAENCSKMRWEIRKASNLSEKIFTSTPFHFAPESVKKSYEKNLNTKFFTSQKMSAKSEPFHFNFCLNAPYEKHRDALLLTLRRRGVFADRMWYNSSADLGRKLINLPIKNNASEKEIKALFLLMEDTLKDLKNARS